MQAQLIDQHYINSFMYTSHSNQAIKQEPFDTCISPQAYQKKRENKKRVTKPSKKIILGKPCYGKHKMNVDELKALSRQIKPYPSSRNSDCTTDIDLLVKKLKNNMNKAKSRMLQQLKQSNPPLYHDICNDEDEDDCSSVSTSSLSTSLPTYQDIYQSLLSLYPFDLSASVKNNTQDVMTEVTEDQINTWLQRGGFSSSPITMVTDQELADLLHLDEL